MPYIVDSYSESNQDTYYTNLGYGQSFTGNGGVLNSVKFYVTKLGSPTGSCYAKIYAHSGTYGTSSISTGSALATSDAIDSSGASSGLVEFTFSGAEKITLSNGTYYVVKIEGSLSGGILCPHADESSPTHDGNLSLSGTAYSGYDLCFYVYADDQIEQEGFAFGTDDGSESAHTLSTQDTNITAPVGTKTLRALLNATGDPASKAFKLKYQKSGSGGYADVPVGATTAGSAGAVEAGDCTESGNNTASDSWAVSHPAASTGDLLIFHIGWDDSTATTGLTAPNGPNGETPTYMTDVITDAGTAVRGRIIYYKATGNWSAGTLTFTPSASEQWTAVVVKVIAGEFDPTTPIGEKNTKASSTTTTDPNLPSLAAGATDGGGRVVGFIVGDVDDPDGSISNWSQRVDRDRGAVGIGLYERTATATNSENISEASGATFPSARQYVSFIYIIRPPRTNNQIYVSTSSNVASGGENTTARLTAPSGKSTSDFDTGRRWDDENGSDSIDITADDYTELEWVLTTQSPATDDDYFEFRVYDGNTALTTYTVTPKWTIGNLPPTVALNSPADTAEITDTTPTLQFTGTDPESNDISYQVQVDTVDTFDSQGSFDFVEDFEGGDKGNFDEAWETNGAVTFDSSGKIAGTYTQKVVCTGEGGGCLAKYLAADYETIYIKFKCLLPTGFYGSATYLAIGGTMDSEWNTLIDIQTEDWEHNRLTLRCADISQWIDTEIILPENQVFEIQMMYTKKTSGGRIKIWVDNDVEGSPDYDSGSMNTGSAQTRLVLCGVNWADDAHNAVYFDEYRASASFIAGNSSKEMLIDALSDADAGFVRAGDTDPFTSGQAVEYTVQAGDELSADTYYWRVRGKDPSGSNDFGAWATTRSFTLKHAAFFSTKVNIQKNRFWVGGSGNWSDTAHWAGSSNGSSGASVPTSTENVYFDQYSFSEASQVVTINETANCKNIDFTGVTNFPEIGGTDSTSTLNVYGNLKFVEGMSLTSTWTGAIYIKATATVDFAGIDKRSAQNNLAIVFAGGVDATYNLAGDIYSTRGNLDVQSGTFNTNNYTIDIGTLGSFLASTANAKTINLGSSTVYINRGVDTAWQLTSATLNAASSTIILNISDSSSRTFYGGDKTYGILKINYTRTSSNGSISITGSNTFSELIIDRPNGIVDSNGHVSLQHGGTQTCGAFSITGESDRKYPSLKSTLLGAAATLSVADNANVDVSNVRMFDITASGDTPFVAKNSSNLGNNTNWLFNDITNTTSAKAWIDAPNEIIRKIIAGSDDGFEYVGGTTFIASANIRIGYRYDTTLACTAGFRFNLINIPQGATIESAYIETTAFQTETAIGAVKTKIYGQDVDDASTFDVDTESPEDKTDLTTANVLWTTDQTWTLNSKYTTPNIASVIQEIVGREGWEEGNSLNIIMKNDDSSEDTHNVVSYDDSRNSPAVLSIVFSTTTATSQLVIAKANIKKNKENQLSALTRILVGGKTVSVEGACSVRKTFAQAVSSIVNIKKGQSNAVLAKTRLKIIGLSNAITAKCSIKKTEEVGIVAKARVQTGGNTNAITAKVRIKKIGITKEILAKVRIQKGSEITVTAKARIKKTESVSTNAKTNIKKTLSASVSAKANLQKTLSNIVSAKSRVEKTFSNSPSSKVRIERIESANISAKANLRDTFSNIISAKARVLVGGQTNSIEAKTAIKQADVSYNISAKARTQRAEENIISAKSRLERIESTIIFGKARIEKTEEDVVIAKSRVQKTLLKNIQAKASIKKTEENDVEVTARIKRTESRNVSAKTNIKQEKVKGDVIAITRITVGGQTKNVQAKCSIKQLAVVKNIEAKVRIKKTEEVFIDAIARISRTEISSLSAKANLKKTLSNSIFAKSRIEKTSLENIEGKVRVKKTEEFSIVAKARIGITEDNNISAKANLQNVFDNDVSAKVRIGIGGVANTLSAKVNIENTYFNNITSVIRIERQEQAVGLSSKVNIKKLFSASFYSKVNILNFSGNSLSAKANIKKGIAETLMALASIKKEFFEVVYSVVCVKKEKENKVSSVVNIKKTQFSSIEAKTRITIGGVANNTISKVSIKKTFLENISSKANVLNDKVASLSSKVKIEIIVGKTILSKINIRNTFAALSTSKCNIKNELANDLFSFVRIQKEFSKTISAKVNLAKSFSGAFSTKTNIKNSFGNLISAKSRILAGGLTNGAESKVNIKNTEENGVEAIVRLLKTADSGFSAKLRIEKAFEKELLSKVNIKRSFCEAVYAISNIKTTIDNIASAKIRIKKVSLSSVIFSLVNIKKGIANNAFAKVNIKSERFNTLNARCRVMAGGTAGEFSAKIAIKKTKIESISTKVAIKKEFYKEISSLVRIRRTLEKSLVAKINIKKTKRGEFSSLTNIKRAEKYELNSRINILVEGVSGEISAKVNIRRTNDSSVLARVFMLSHEVSSFVVVKTNIKKTLSVILSASANIRSSVAKKISAKINVKSLFSEEVLARINIKQTLGILLSSKVRISAEDESNLYASVNIKGTKAVSFLSKVSTKKSEAGSVAASVLITKTETASFDVLVRVSRLVASSISSFVDIKAQVFQAVSSKVAIKSTAQKEASSKVRIICYKETALNAKVFILKVNQKIADAIVNIKKTAEKLSNSLVSIRKTFSKNFASKTRIKKEVSAIFTAKARISTILVREIIDQQQGIKIRNVKYPTKVALNKKSGIVVINIFKSQRAYVYNKRTNIVKVKDMMYYKVEERGWVLAKVLIKIP